ncbi:dihydroorotase [Alphaproteobacteria bacterium]|nr:dihydroorotase [Alphaproteobacteria bacterium]
MIKINSIQIIQPDDWHVHLRENEMLEAVIQYSSRINKRCIVMPNLTVPVTTLKMGLDYKAKINSSVDTNNFIPLLPCYLTESLDLNDFEIALQKSVFIGAKLYPTNATTNSSYGISKIENIYPALEILEKLDKPLLIHGEKVRDDIDIFDREKYFIDDELALIRKKFPNIKIILEHVSSKYGADFVNESYNIAGTITPHHMMLTKKDVFHDNYVNPDNFCMPVVKDEKDLIALRHYACSGNNKFFLGTDSAPHHINFKTKDMSSKPGIFSAPCSLELYTTIFDEENSIEQLEKFASINGPNFYNLPINKNYIRLNRIKWKMPEFTIFRDIKVKNFMSGKEINWKIE